MSKITDYIVVWSGRDSLLPNRAERRDLRFDAMPTFDIDDGEMLVPRISRKYSRTGKHVGKCSRTDPSAPQYKPWVNKKANPSG